MFMFVLRDIEYVDIWFMTAISAMSGNSGNTASFRFNLSVYKVLSFIYMKSFSYLILGRMESDLSFECLLFNYDRLNFYFADSCRV